MNGGVTMVQLELWQLITLLILFLGCVGGFGKLLLDIHSKALETRFAGFTEAFAKLETSRSESRTEWNKEFERLEEKIDGLAQRLPSEYVRREDWIRFSATIDAKLDSLHDRLDKIAEKAYARN
jgi:hypothetical protein